MCFGRPRRKNSKPKTTSPQNDTNFDQHLAPPKRHLFNLYRGPGGGGILINTRAVFQGFGGFHGRFQDFHTTETVRYSVIENRRFPRVHTRDLRVPKKLFAPPVWRGTEIHKEVMCAPGV